jgi:hypothetical protein
LSKISGEGEPVLQKLVDFIDLRFDKGNKGDKEVKGERGGNYKADSVNFIKDLYYELSNY